MRSQEEIVERNKQIKEKLRKSICLSEVEADLILAVMSRKARFEAGQAALSEETDRNGNKIPLWELVNAKIAEFIKPSGQTSYVEWHTGIMDIFAALCTLAKASHHSPSLLKEGLIWAHNFRKNQWKLTYGTPSSSIKYDIGVDENGVLKTQLYLNNKLVSPEDAKQKLIKEEFDRGVDAWLEHRGFIKNGQTGVVTNAQTNEVLTPAKFKEINQDDNEGLKAYFSGNYKLNIEQAPDDPTPPSTTPAA
ncbi:hypothetical protein ACQUW5_01910 [Legionella sp. CNM-1927-20]|uniref:hypothetical protein n=1 Tax=Legionella sp. CNM-1927-20 TaxID=3422221 RepID=UPI00403AA09B